jgi:MFS family permease
MQKGRFDEAYKVIKRLHGGYADDPGFFQREYDLMREQLEYENAVVKPTFKEIVMRPSYRKRFILGILIQSFVQLSGVNVINYYQTTMYRGLGITGRSVLFVSAMYGCMGPIANAICLLFVDKWGRKKPLAYLSFALGIDMIIFTALTAHFSTGGNRLGQGFAIAMIFCFSVIFSLGYNTIQFVFQSEIFPLHLRAKGVAAATLAATTWNIVFNQASPSAFVTIGWKYYIVFVVTNIVAGVVFLVFFPETKGLSLEEMAILFGDDVIIPATSEEAIRRGLHSTVNANGEDVTTHGIDDKDGIVHEEVNSRQKTV